MALKRACAFNSRLLGCVVRKLNYELEASHLPLARPVNVLRTPMDTPTWLRLEVRQDEII